MYQRIVARFELSVHHGLDMNQEEPGAFKLVVSQFYYYLKQRANPASQHHDPEILHRQ
jgi:hypothetical protein